MAKVAEFSNCFPLDLPGSAAQVVTLAEKLTPSERSEFLSELLVQACVALSDPELASTLGQAKLLSCSV
ncbi:MAG: hypothetical protein AAGF76_13640, partial [Pseudomonadota bacterium]